MTRLIRTILAALFFLISVAPVQAGWVASVEVGYSFGGASVFWDVAPYYTMAGDPDANSYAYVGQGGRVALGSPFSSYVFLVPSSGDYVEYFSVIPYYTGGWIPRLGGLYITGYIQEPQKNLFYLRTDRDLNPVAAIRYSDPYISNAVIYKTIKDGSYLIHTGYVEHEGRKHMFLMSTLQDGSSAHMCVFEDSLESVALDVVPLGGIDYVLIGYAWDRYSRKYGVRVVASNIQCALHESGFYVAGSGADIVGYAGALTRGNRLHVVGTSVNSDNFKKAFMLTLDIPGLSPVSSYEYVSPGGYRDSSLAVFDVVADSNDLILVGVASPQYLLRDGLPKVIREGNGNVTTEYPSAVCGGDAMAFRLHDNGSPSWGYLVRYGSYQDEHSSRCSYEGVLYSVKLSGTNRIVSSGHLSNVPDFLDEYGYAVEALRSNGSSSNCEYLNTIASVHMKIEKQKIPVHVVMLKPEAQDVPMLKDTPFFTTCRCNGGCTTYTTSQRLGYSVGAEGASCPDSRPDEIEGIFRVDGSAVANSGGVEDLPKGIYFLKTKRGIRKVIVR